MILTFAILVMALQFADIFLTRIGLNVGCRELNPVARWAFRSIGFWPSCLVKIVLSGLIVFFLVLAEAVWMLLALVYLYCALVGWNLAKVKYRKGVA